MIRPVLHSGFPVLGKEQRAVEFILGVCYIPVSIDHPTRPFRENHFTSLTFIFSIYKLIINLGNGTSCMVPFKITAVTKI